MKSLKPTQLVEIDDREIEEQGTPTWLMVVLVIGFLLASPFIFYKAPYRPPARPPDPPVVLTPR